MYMYLYKGLPKMGHSKFPWFVTMFPVKAHENSSFGFMENQDFTTNTGMIHAAYDTSLYIPIISLPHFTLMVFA
jgi:hypothetical protein